MMNVLVFGSANIDRTYAVDHIVQPGETISCARFETHCGGKGFNQAIALSRAGAHVAFAGAIGPDGAMLEQALIAEGIDISCLIHSDHPTGHAVIQVTPQAQNSIIIDRGANASITPEDVDAAIGRFSPGDLIVLQNEISSFGEIITAAHEKGMVIALNPSPIDEALLSLDLSRVDYLLVNEIEGAALSGFEDPERILHALHDSFPHTCIVLTLGGEGGMLIETGGGFFCFEPLAVSPVDTTAAGDTFTGYFLAEAISGSDMAHALEMARIASGISVTRHGAACSIPFRSEVEQYMEGDRR